MSYVSKILQPGERVLGTGRMHWIIYARGTILVLLSIVVMLVWPATDGPAATIRFIVAGLFIVLGLVSLAANAIAQWTTEIAVTDRRVIHKRGLIRRETGEMNMSRVESVEVDQSVLGRILDAVPAPASRG